MAIKNFDNMTVAEIKETFATLDEKYKKLNAEITELYYEPSEDIDQDFDYFERCSSILADIQGVQERRQNLVQKVLSILSPQS